MDPLIEPWEFLAGLGIFLYGMRLLELALHELAGPKFNRFLRHQTHSPIRGVLGGTFATMCLQSSSMVGLLVLAFVGAGIIQMRDALGIIFGANLGTTFTGWVVTLLGFKLNLTEFAIQLVALGGLGVAFIKRSTKSKQVTLLILGVGFLLLGLGFMKSSIEGVAQSVGIEIFREYHPIVYVAGAALFTAIIQSSSATMMIVLSAINAGVMPLETAALVVIGADLGTTSTMMLGGLSGTRAKRQVALSHLIFNLVIDLIALAMVSPLLTLVVDIFGFEDPMYALVAFHSSFNLIGILLFLPFVDPFAKLLQKLVKTDQRAICQYIDKVPARVTVAALAAIENESRRLLLQCIWLNARCFRLDKSKLFGAQEFSTFVEDISANKLVFDDAYAEIKQLEDEIVRYIYRVQRDTQDELANAECNRLIHRVRHAVVAAKTIKDIRPDLVQLRHCDTERLVTLYKLLKREQRFLYENILRIILHDNPAYTTEKASTLAEHSDQLHASLEQVVREQGLAGPTQAINISSLFNIGRAVSISQENLLAASTLGYHPEEVSVTD